MPTLETVFSPRANGYNAMRLVFAGSVIAWHAIYLGGYTAPEAVQFLSDIGVDGFFVLSGFLITRSFTRTPSAARFMWHRLLRIFPAFWVCLVVTTLVAGAVWLRAGGGLGGYLTAERGPFTYVLSNADLRITQWDIAGTPANVPHRDGWNTSLWTLWWEFQCYLGVLVAGLIGLYAAGRRWIVATAFVLAYALAAGTYLSPSFADALPGPLADHGTRFYTTFLAGSVLYLFAGRVPVDRRLLLVAGVWLVAAIVLAPRDYRVFALLPFAYLLLAGGALLRSPGLIDRHDVSYGVYIYGYVVQQLLAVLGATSLGYPVFAVLGFSLTVPVAIASWLLVERRALTFKNAFSRRRDPEPDSPRAVA